MFITFEGIDGCGKSTQIKLLAKHLKSIGKEVVLIREPGGTSLSENIREILLNSKHNINEISELLLFEAARAELTEKVIKPALDKGAYVLSDRFYDSTSAYQGYGRGIDLDKIDILNKVGALGIEPDVTFYLDIPLEMSQVRSGEKIKDRMERESDDFFRRVIEGFREIAKKNPKRVIMIDASKEIEATYNLILKEIGKF